MKWFEQLTTGQPADVIPKDFYTIRQMAEVRGLSQCRIREIMRPEIKAGRVAVKHFRINQGEKPIPHYGKASPKNR